MQLYVILVLSHHDHQIPDAYCNCGISDGWFDHWDPSEIWVDVVFIRDTSMVDQLEEVIDTADSLELY